MKPRFILLLLVSICSCSDSENKRTDPFPNLLHSDVTLITYEGILPSAAGDSIGVELHLVPGTPGMDSYYRMHEELERPERAMSTVSQGTYAILYGSGTEYVLHLTGRRNVEQLMRGTLADFRSLVAEDLLLKSRGDHELIMVDRSFREFSPAYRLIRRSELFTVEGYVTVYKDTADFFERNTRKAWPVAQIAQYPAVVKKYKALATEKFEGVYLKALSYSISHIDASGNEVDALVFKEILLMDSTGGLLIH